MNAARVPMHGGLWRHQRRDDLEHRRRERRPAACVQMEERDGWAGERGDLQHAYRWKRGMGGQAREATSSMSQMRVEVGVGASWKQGCRWSSCRSKDGASRQR